MDENLGDLQPSSDESQSKNVVKPKKENGFLKFLKWVEHWLHTLGGAVFVVTTISAIFAVVANAIPLSTNIKNVSRETWLAVAASFFSCGFIASVIASFVYNYMYKRTRNKLRESARAKEQLEDKIKKYQAPEPLFRRWAEKNSSCDKLLFDVLFYKAASDLRAAVDAIEENIEDTIQYASDILTAFTGNLCAVSFQILDKDHKNWYLQPESKWRDQESRKVRKNFDGGKTYIPTNSSYVEIIDHGKDHFRHDDLKNCPSYINMTARWNDYFNAISITPVLRFDQAADEYPCLGLLIADSKHKGLATETVTHYLVEISDRLAVMSYRLKSLTTKQSQNLGTA